MNTTRLGIALVFVAGCAVGGASARFVVPPASAQQAVTLTKWEYRCFTSLDSKKTAELANILGAQGWELATATNNEWCSKRPKL